MKGSVSEIADAIHESVAGSPSPWRAYLAVVVPLGAVLVGVQLMAPSLRPYLYHEGGLIENWSATLVLFAVLLGAWACRTSSDPRVKRHYWAIPAVAAAVFLDEISDGIWEEKPRIGGIKVGSFHDSVHVAFDHWWALDSVWMQLAPLALGAAIAASVALRFGPQASALARFLAGDLSYRLVGVAAVLGAVALILDRDPGDAITFWEEWLELNGALALLFAAALVPATLYQEPRAQWVAPTRSRGFRRVFWACLAAATLCGVLLV